MEDREFREMLNYFEKNASPDELEELRSLMSKTKTNLDELPSNSSGGVFNVGNMAKNMADQISQQMGVTDEAIKRTARQMVRDMILQYDPHIPEKTIQVLLDKWVPEKNKKQKVKLPKEIIGTMISQFVGFSRGELSKSQVESFPSGWKEKYWESFPENIQKLIAIFLREEISKEQFWETIDLIISNA